MSAAFSRYNTAYAVTISHGTAHPGIKGLKAIDLQFLPQDTTCCIQPMDQWVINYVVFVYNNFFFFFYFFFKKVVLHIETVPRSAEENVLLKRNFYKINTSQNIRAVNIIWGKKFEYVISIFRFLMKFKSFFLIRLKLNLILKVIMPTWVARNLSSEKIFKLIQNLRIQ